MTQATIFVFNQSIILFFLWEYSLFSRPEFIEFFGVNSSSVNSLESDNGKTNETVAKSKTDETEDPSTPVMINPKEKYLS